MSDILVVVMTKHGEQWCLLFTDATRSQALRTLGRWAADPELKFNWYDAALLARKVANSSA